MDLLSLLIGLLIGIAGNLLTEPLRRLFGRWSEKTRLTIHAIAERDQKQIEAVAEGIRGDGLSAGFHLLRAVHARITAVFWLICALGLFGFSLAAVNLPWFAYTAMALGAVILNMAGSNWVAANRMQRVAEQAVAQRAKDSACDDVRN